MEIVNAGVNYRHPSGFSINRENGSGDFLLLIIKSDAYAVINGVRYGIEKNSAIIYKRGTPQLYGSDNGEFINDWIHFELYEGEDELFCELKIPFDTPIVLGQSTDYGDFVRRIFLERYSENRHRDLSMKRYFELILLKIAEQISKEKKEEEHAYYNTFCALRNEIKLTPQRDWSISEIEKITNLSRSYLQHLYKNFFGVGIIADLKNARMEFARHLLSTTDMTVFEVARSCGYQSDVHFMRIFKRTVGATPSEYRESFKVSKGELLRANEKNPFCK